MNESQQIRAKALEIAVLAYSALKGDKKVSFSALAPDGESLFMNIAKAFDMYITGPQENVRNF